MLGDKLVTEVSSAGRVNMEDQELLACGFLHSNSGVGGLILRDVIRSFRWTIFLEDMESNQGKPFLAYNGFSLTHCIRENGDNRSNSLCFT